MRRVLFLSAIAAACCAAQTNTPIPSTFFGLSKVTYAGINGEPGLFQFNVVIPANAPDGDNLLVATLNGANTQPSGCLTGLGILVKNRLLPRAARNRAQLFAITYRAATVRTPHLFVKFFRKLFLSGFGVERPFGPKS